MALNLFQTFSSHNYLITKILTKRYFIFSPLSAKAHKIWYRIKNPPINITARKTEGVLDSKNPNNIIATITHPITIACSLLISNIGIYLEIRIIRLIRNYSAFSSGLASSASCFSSNCCSGFSAPSIVASLTPPASCSASAVADVSGAVVPSSSPSTDWLIG